MLEDPGFDPRELGAGLRAGYGIAAGSFRFVPGYDQRAASYEVRGADAGWFLRVRLGPADGPQLEVPRALLDAGVGHVLAPIRTLAERLTHALGDGRTLVLYPYAAGRSAMRAGMTDEQWRTFGGTLRAVHDSGLAARFARRLPAETFGLPAGDAVRRALEAAPSDRSPAAARMAGVLEGRRAQVEAILERAEELGEGLRHRSFALVLCHADIHAANILVTDDGGILLVDWDGPMLAPRERDLLFVIGSRIARRVTPQEEAWFFDGYGRVPVDADALVYYRYERVLEDIGEISRTVLFEPVGSEASRAEEVELLETFFEPGNILETVEVV